MKKLFAGGLMGKLIALFLAVSLLPILGVSVVSFLSGRTALRDSASSGLEAVRKNKAREIVHYLEGVKGELFLLADLSQTKAAYNMLSAFHESTAVPADGPFPARGDEYDTICQQIDGLLRKHVQKLAHEDLAIICAAHGHVMYSATRGEYLGENLRTGTLKNGPLAHLWEDVMERRQVCLTDYHPHGTSKEPAAFGGAPIVDDTGELKAVLAVHLGSERIDEIMAEREGLGETGECYIIGQDLLMRTNSHRAATPTLLSRKVETAPAHAVVDRHKSGTGEAIDYRGTPVLSSYDHMEINEELGEDFEWFIIAEIDRAEALAPVHRLAGHVAWLTIAIAVVVVLVGYLAARGIVVPIQGASDTLGTSTAEISSSVAQVTAGATETAAAVNETTATVEELKQTSEVNSQKAKQVSDTARAAAEIGVRGNEAVERVTDEIERIKQQMDAVAGSVMNLSEQTQSISEIIGSVDDISEQSNLLAVNAAVEAAKAGDHGKGFAVVAQEIRNLAEQSKDATRRVRGILSDIQKATGSTVMATEQGTKAVESGVREANEAGDSIRQLAESIEEAARAAIQIAASSHQQMVGVDQVAAAMENIKDATSQNVDSMKQLDEAARNLRSVGMELVALVRSSSRRNQ